ncbi:SARP family transcriptional regulator [Rhizobium leguminosarum]|uniref:SARP family transcriptional regulator n=3 Tax=Rhizobium TaxID=379 RepID=A0A444ID14_RHILE|nr:MULTISPECIES: SARP family transcriptional regulator [Rhizobium]MBY5455889.1 SARP family transcriptional regulator [Rhizobium leguminosarum]RWX37345.1 SARP family transcriptional regulator [Rhizobium leguminosarum]TBC60791.1 SARP family transcriptional regulator [Rhizobium leguminosarum]TBC87326.1 SARP family transcriptional regulator [Rhizobium leguminosarum]TBC87865.1 SARP family transcriptional regulator [Rhizobium leguminosarum]
MKLRLESFGELRLIDLTGKPVAFPEKGLLAICYLLDRYLQDGAGSEYPRSALARFLWDSHDNPDIMANLRKTISRIQARQTELGTELLVFTSTGVRIKPDAFVCDLFELAKPDGDGALEKLRRLVAVLRQDFLAVLADQSVSTRQWIAGQRDKHMAILVDALKTALPAARSREDVSLIKEAALRIFRDAPDDENIRRILLEAYESEGQLENARRLFDASRHGLESALDVGLDVQALGEVRKVFAGSQSPPSVMEPPSDGGGRAPRPLPRLVLLPPGGMDAAGALPMLSGPLIEDVTIGLCALNTVSVVAPHTAARIARNADKAELILRHSISYVLDTRLTDHAGIATLFVQLIHAGGDEVIWAERFSLEKYDLISHRRDIARRIARELAGQVRRHETMRDSFEGNSAAYHSYLLGLRDVKRLSLPDIRRSRKAFREALQHSAHFAPALSGLSRTFLVEWLLTARGDSELLGLAEDYANRAIVADPSLAAGFRELGVAKLYLGDIDESVLALKLAEELGPHYADGIASYADTLVHASRPADALAKIERAISLNPLSPTDYLWTAAGANFALGHYAEALEQISAMDDRTPADRLSAACWAMLGDTKNARLYMRKVREIYPDFDVDKWLSVVPFKEQWQKEQYREALRRAGF